MYSLNSEKEDPSKIIFEKKYRGRMQDALRLRVLGKRY